MVTFATKHNGGRSQTNLNFLQTGGEYPFINVMKTSEDWKYWQAPNANANVDPSARDTDGYPTSIQTGGYYTVVYIPTQTDLPGDWVMAWDGNGTVRVPGTLTSAVGSDTSSGGSGSLTFTPTNQRILPGVISTSVSPNHIRNIRVYHSSEASRVAAGEIFGSKFLARLQEANFGVIRFLNWQSGNNSTVYDWSQKTPTTYHTYETHYRWIPSLYFGSATLSGQTYSITTGRGRAPQHGDVIQAKIGTGYTSLAVTVTSGNPSILATAHGLSIGSKVYWQHFQSPPTGFTANTPYYVTSSADSDHIALAATPGGVAITPSGGYTGRLNPVLYLNADSTGAVEMLSQYASYLSHSDDTNTYPVTNEYVTFLYDGDLGWLKYGGDGASHATGLDTGVPIEVCLQLCAQVGAHPWFVAHWFTLDPMTDYMPSLIQYVHDNQQSWMIPRFEGPNELWNAIFLGTGYANAKALAHWGSSDYNKWYGKIISTLGQAAASVYGVSKSPNTYHLISGVQTATYTFPSGNDERFKSTSYVGQAAAAQSGYTKAPGYNYITHLACAQYWNPSYKDQATETALAAAYGSAGAAGQTDIANTYADSCNIGTSFPMVGCFDTVYSAFKTYLLALPTPVNGMCGYEGCYSPDYSFNTTTDILRHAGRSGANMGAYLAAVYNSFTKQTDSTFTAEFPSNFILGDFNAGGNGTNAGGVTSYVWSVFSGDIYATATPQWTAICRYNAAVRAPGLRMRLHT